MTPRSRWITIALALVAAIGFALSVEWGQWWSIDKVSIGPLGGRQCFGGECQSTGLTFVGGSALWMRTGLATGSAGLIDMFALVLLAGALAAKRTPRLVAKLVLSATVTALAAAAYFVAAFPGLGGATLDIGALLFVIAIVIAVIAAVRVLRTPLSPT